MEKELRAELRKFLTGRTVRDEDGLLVAVPDKSYLVYHGVADRTGYRKIKSREEHKKVADNGEEAFYIVLEALQNVGILANLETMPDALCVLCRFFLTKAVVLCVSPEEDGHVLVQAYTGRSLTAGICCRMAIEKLMKKIEEITNQ